MFGRNKGLIDSVKDRRVGLLYLYSNYSSLTIINPNSNSSYNILAEVIEIYNDKLLSKIEITNLSFNSSEKNLKYVRKNLNLWIKSSSIYWLEPSISVKRDNKLTDILR